MPARSTDVVANDSPGLNVSKSNRLPLDVMVVVLLLLLVAPPSLLPLPLPLARPSCCCCFFAAKHTWCVAIPSKIAMGMPEMGLAAPAPKIIEPATSATAKLEAASTVAAPTPGKMPGLLLLLLLLLSMVASSSLSLLLHEPVT